jgi:hypothetical protein
MTLPLLPCARRRAGRRREDDANAAIIMRAGIRPILATSGIKTPPAPTPRTAMRRRTRGLRAPLRIRGRTGRSSGLIEFLWIMIAALIQSDLLGRL